MSTPFILSASILSADFHELGNQIRQAEEGGVDWIHVDVMDGHFVPNITMGPFIVEACRQITALPLDVHLMVEKPELFIEDFIRAGADRLSIHIENNPNVLRTLQAIRSLGAHPGIVLNPGTPANAIAAVLPFIDHVLVMTVNPGYSGQQFIPETVIKVNEVRRMLDQSNPEALVEVDGGIAAETINLVVQAGARAIVAATAVFRYPDGIAAGIQVLRKAVK